MKSMASKNSSIGLSAKDFKNYPRPVVQVLSEAINEHEVTYRLLDGNHLRLYCGDRSVIPLKVSATRPSEQTMRYLIPWLEENVSSWSSREITEDALRLLKSAVDTHDYSDEQEGSRQEGPVTGEDGQPISEQEQGQPEWTPFIPRTSGKDYGFETDGSVYRCSTCGYTQDSPRGLHLHHARHTGKIKESRAKAVENRALRQAQRKAMLEQAVTVLAEHHGVLLDTSALEKENQRLTKENESLVLAVQKLKADLDETRTRLSLIKEAMKA